MAALSSFPLIALLTAVLAFVLAMGASRPAIWLAGRLHLVDTPGTAPHKTHLAPKPLAGGILLAASMVAASWALGSWRDPHLRALQIAAIVVFALGLWDDARGANAWIKLSVQTLALTVLLAGGVEVNFASSLRLLPLPFDGWADVAITWLWIVGMTNAVNLVDSMDGLALGLAMIALLYLAPLAAIAAQPALCLFGAALLGICAGTYVFNRTPARLFLGDSGSETLGFLLGGIALIYVPPGRPQASSWFLPIMLLGLPILDTVSVVYGRLRRRQSILQGRRDHVYDRLRSVGLGAAAAVGLMHLSAATLGALAIVALYQRPIIANTIFALCGAASVAAILLLDRIETAT